ncbi:MAG: hypothetical protein JJU18_05755 [Oceanicaulis sp.]|nr:hypothetical protein [Oceanicaulis sp.]
MTEDTTQNVFIGFGGTGAKIAECVMHLCAAGLGPRSITLGIGDQDDSGGNTRAALDTLEKYIKVQRRLRSQEGKFAIPESARKEPLFRTRIDPVYGGDGPDLQLNENIWIPQPRDGGEQTLRKAADLGAADPHVEDLLELLFAEGGSEQELDLAKGFQGRPHVGAASILLSVDGSDFWQNLKEILDSAQQHKTRIFLAGSAFGGTGASSFPTMARLIRKTLGEKHSGVQVSGVLMLPYFKFPPPRDEGDQHAARADEFFAQTKHALDYYAGQLDQGEFFDDLYVIGWEPLIDLGYFSKGDATQKNPPLVPELLAALAAMREFQRPVSKRGSGAKHAGQVHLLARKSKTALSWSDLPPATIETELAPHDTVRARLAQWLRFAYAWRYRYRPAFNKNQRKLLGGETWFKNHLAGVDFNDNPFVDEMSDFVDRALLYFAGMSAWSKEAMEFRLWNADAFARSSVEVTAKGPRPPSLLSEDEAAREKYAGFDRILVAEAIEDAPRDISECWNWLGARKSDPKTIGAFTAALYQSVALAMGEERK